MTLRTNARVAGFTYWIYFASGIGGLLLAALVVAGHLGRVAAAVGVRTDVRGVADHQRRHNVGGEAIGVTLLPIHIVSAPEAASL